MTSENTKRLTSICLVVLSVILGVVAIVIKWVLPPENQYPNIYGVFILLFWFAAFAIGILAIIYGRLVKFRAGVIVGCVGVGFSVLLFILLHIGFLLSVSASRMPCQRAMQNLSSVMQQYCRQNEGSLPDAERWCNQLVKSVKNGRVFWHPYWSGKIIRGPNGEISNFAFNENLDGYRLADIDRQTVLLFETDAGWNQNGTSDILLPKVHPGYYVLIEGGAHFLFVGPDSTFTVKFIKNSEIDSLNWEK